MADMRHCYGLIVAQIWQTGADRPSAIIPCGMWARWKSQLWAGSGPQQFWCVGQMWASSASFIFFMADMWHCYGLIVAQIWQTGAVRPSAIIPRGMWARWKCQLWAGSGPQQFCYLGK